MYLKNTWYVAAWSSEIAPGAVVARTILEQPIALFRRGNGTLAALHDQCPHRFAPLSNAGLYGFTKLPFELRS